MAERAARETLREAVVRLSGELMAQHPGGLRPEEYPDAVKSILKSVGWAPKPSPGERSELGGRIREALARHGPMTARQLSAELGRSVCAIYAALKVCGAVRVRQTPGSPRGGRYVGWFDIPREESHDVRDEDTGAGGTHPSAD